MHHRPAVCCLDAFLLTGPDTLRPQSGYRYLTESAVHGTLAVLARLLAPGSHLILTYMHKGALDGSGTFKGARRWKSWVRFSGEPFIFGFDPANLAEALRPLGFLLKNDVSTEEAARHYCGPIGRDECGS